MTTEEDRHPRDEREEPNPESASENESSGGEGHQPQDGELNERLRILSMLAEGTISPDEAEELLKALEPEPDPAGRLLQAMIGGRPGSGHGIRGVIGPHGAFSSQGPFGPQGVPGPHGPVGPQGPFGPRGPFGPQGPAASAAAFVGVAPRVELRWDRPGMPAAPVPPVPAVSPVPPAPPVPPFSWVETPGAPPHPRPTAARSLAFSLKETGRELNSSLPLNLAKNADRFLPRPLRQSLEGYGVDLGALVELAEATDDEAIGADGLDLFHVKDAGAELTITLERPSA